MMEGESGEYLGTIPAPPDTSYSMGVAVDADDNIYLAQRGRLEHEILAKNTLYTPLQNQKNVF